MKKTVAHPEIIEKQSRTRIEKLLRACRKLRTNYLALEGLADCPLCQILRCADFQYDCKECPYVTIRGLDNKPPSGNPCMARKGICVVFIRSTPRKHKNSAAYRARELRWWIEVYEAELERRGPKPATCVKG